jgi:hypothetical protein
MSGTYYYKIFRDNVEITSDSINVIVNPNEKILFEDKSKISICKDTIELTAVANPEGCKIMWKPINIHDNKVIIKKTGKYTVYVENKFGCIDSATIDIRLYPPVQLKISSNGNKLCKGDAMLLSANKIYSEYLWSTGDTTHDIVISKGGKYFLKVKSDGGCEGIDSITIEEFEKPIVEFDKSVYVLCKGDSLILNPLKINPEYEYVWSDGYLGIERIIKEDANLFLIAKLPNGCNDTAFVMVGFFDVPVATIIADKTEACFGEKIKLIAKDYNPKLNYLWSNGQKEESITVAKSGTYNLIISAGTFCSDTTEIAVQIYPDLVLELLSDNKNLCFSDSIKIYPKMKYDSYQWSTGETTESITVREAGTYQLIVKNSYGCSDTAVFKLDALQKPVAKITADRTEACFGEKITLKADNFNPGYDYNWSNTEKGESITIDKSGTYSLIVSNGNLCADTTQINVKIYPNLALEVVADNTNLCFGDSTRIYPKSKYDKYSWSTGENTESITVHESGVYQLIVQNKIGCSDTAQIEIFKYNPKLTSDIENLTFNELCLGNFETKNIKLTLKSDNDLAISNIYFKSNIFKINNLNSFLKTYKSNETIDLPITFKPSDAGEFIDTLVIESGEPCHYKKEIPVYGISKALFQFSLPNIISEAGDYLMIPINAGMTCLNSGKLNSNYEIEISFDKEYFIPDSVKYDNIIENKIVGQNRILKIKGITEFIEKKDSLLPINYIYGMALVGRKEIISLSIDSVNFTNKRYYPEFVNGSLKIEGCVNNLRPIQMFKTTTLIIAPNPTDGDIKMSIETQEQGSFKIEIFNIQGQSIYAKEFTKSNASYEEFEFNYNTQEMGSGVYSVHLTSPWHIIREQLLISK